MPAFGTCVDTGESSSPASGDPMVTVIVRGTSQVPLRVHRQAVHAVNPELPYVPVACSGEIARAAASACTIALDIAFGSGRLVPTSDEVGKPMVLCFDANAEGAVPVNELRLGVYALRVLDAMSRSPAHFEPLLAAVLSTSAPSTSAQAGAGGHPRSSMSLASRLLDAALLRCSFADPSVTRAPQSKDPSSAKSSSRKAPRGADSPQSSATILDLLRDVEEVVVLLARHSLRRHVFPAPPPPPASASDSKVAEPSELESKDDGE